MWVHTFKIKKAKSNYEFVKLELRFINFLDR